MTDDEMQESLDQLSTAWDGAMENLARAFHLEAPQINLKGLAAIWESYEYAAYVDDLQEVHDYRAKLLEQ